MRKLNAILTALILALFLAHAVLGAFQLLGTGDTVSKGLAHTAAALAAAHALIGLKLTLDSLAVWRRTGTAYFRENLLFWARRLSGFAVLVLLVLHLTAFGYTSAEGAYRLRWFGGAQLIGQLLLVAALALHVLSNLRPMLIAFGCQRLRAWVGEILFVLSVLLLFMAAAFAVYYLRWNLW